MKPDVETQVELRPVDLPVDAAAFVDLIEDVNQHDGVDWFPTVASLINVWSPTPLYDPPRDTRVIERDGRFVGAARTSWREREGAIVHRIEIWVRPSSRRQGLGRRLLAWAEERARAAAAEGAGSGELTHVFGANTGDDVPAGVAFAELMGYRPVRFHYEMRRALDVPIPDVPLPDGLEIRPVQPAQHRTIWDADEEAFRDHWDAATVTEDDFRTFFANPDIDPSLWQVAWLGEEVAGLVVNGIYPHENERTGIKIGWLDSVATRRPWRKRGVASALIARSLAILRDRGMEVAALGVDVESPTGALSLYEGFGFQRHRAWIFLRKPF